MKPLLLVAFLSILTLSGYSQRNTIFGLSAGGGCAVSNNYNIGLSGGVDYAKGFTARTFLGAEIFYQQYSLLYDREANSARGALGVSGEIIRHKSAYAFFAPKFRFCAGRYHHTHFYANAGIGLKTGGYDSVRRFSSVYTTAGYMRTDTTLDMSSNINGMVMRIGVGWTQYMPIGNHWRFTFTTDLGFLPGSLTKSGSYEDVTRTVYSPAKLNPAYVSVRIGIAHTRFP